MARISKEMTLRRKALIKKARGNNPSITKTQLKKMLRENGIQSTLEIIQRDIDSMGDLKTDTTFETVSQVLASIEDEIELNKKFRDEAQNESAKSQFSRLIKDLLTKKADLAKELISLHMAEHETVRPIHAILIGDFPTSKTKKEKKEFDDKIKANAKYGT